MEIIIGRNAGTRQLNVELGAKVSVYGQANTVPLDVSRRHISLTKRPDGNYELKNLNEKNVTYVNGLAVEHKVVSETDKIELGMSRYLMQWEAIVGKKVETVDIRPLESVWEEYNQETIRIRNQQKK